jgi:hypothetical protein
MLWLANRYETWLSCDRGAPPAEIRLREYGSPANSINSLDTLSPPLRTLRAGRIDYSSDTDPFAHL